jgi:hypothetical protein
MTQQASKPRYAIFLNRRYMRWSLFDNQTKRTLISGMSREDAIATLKRYNAPAPPLADAAPKER